jgi:hypothetical protein
VIVSWIVFLFSLVIVGISLVPVLFPALIASAFDTLKLQGAGVPNPYDAGVLAGPLIAVNVIVLGLALLYFRGRLPGVLSEKIRALFAFEVSKKTTLIVMVVFLSVYVGLAGHEMFEEPSRIDFENVEKRLQSWDISDFAGSFEPHASYLFDTISYSVFGSYKVIPFISSVLLVVLVFFITRNIAHKNFAGIAASVILLQSYVFLDFDSSVTYPSYWITLYLFSLYLINKRWSPLSVAPYVVSIFAKALTAMFLPMSLFFAYRANISRKRKVVVLASYGIVIVAGLAGFSAISSQASGSGISFNDSAFWQGFASMSFQMRFDGLVVLFLLPLIIGLFLASKHGIRHADSIMVLIAGMLLSAPLLAGFTDQTNQPYRFLPLVVFFAMGVGVLLTKRQLD